MGAQNTKLLQEVVRDSRALIKGSSKDTLKQLVNRRKEMEAELQAVVKHKEELLARRAAAVQGIVKDYEARRQRVVDQLHSAAASPSAVHQVRSAASDGASSPGLPSPESLLGRVEELLREEAEGKKEQGEEGGGRRA